jgi:uncharacterized repeat protein (TIGR01451 family)
MNMLLSLGSKVRFLPISKIPILILFILGVLPGQAFAQLSCNSTFSGEVGDGNDIFYNKPVEISINIGAGEIENGTYLDIYQLAFGPDCQPFGGISDCASQGNNVVFNGITSTDCTDENGALVDFTVTPDPGPAGPPAEVYNFTPNNAIRNFEPGEGRPNSCSISFSVTVISLVNEDPPPPISNSRLYEAIGWKLENGLCENGQSTGQDINYSFDVSIPKIDIEKSTNGEDADTPTGPYIPLGDAVEWIYTVTNTGNVPLDNIVVTDDLLGTIGGCPSTSLESGESMDCTTPDGVATLGQYVNESDVIGRYITDFPATGDGVDVTDEDPSHYFGIDPSIVMKKYISIDNGATYADANVAPFPTAVAPSGALYRITVENTGLEDLENVVVTDPTLGLTYNVGSLLAGQTIVLDEGTVPAIPELSVEEVCSAPGTFLNTASVNGNAVDLPDATVSDDDPATMVCIDPSITSPCNFRMVSEKTVISEASYEACEILVLGPDFIAADGSTVSVSSGWEIDFMLGFLIEQGATLKATVCGQSLCVTSDSPMPYGCHSCVDQICDRDRFCCYDEFDQVCLDMVDTICGLVCE